jgi:tetratricopeptide (TPR) repeat protein
VATNPSSTAFVELAAAYRERGDLDRALRLCLRGIQRHPTHVEAHYELGRIYEGRGERELALDEWGIVQQLAPDHLASRLALVRLYMDEGRQAEAREELKAAIEHAPSDPVVAELWEVLKAAPVGEAGTVPGGVFDSLASEFPGTLGVLLVDGEGGVLEGSIPSENGESMDELGVNMVGARAEAERVAGYLQLGELRGMVVESGSTRLTVSPIGKDVVIVATGADIPAGQAARVVQRAWEIADSYLGRMGR